MDAGLFHAFHQQWIIALCNGLNAGVLPSDYFALPEQHIRGPSPDMLTLHLSSGDGTNAGGGVAVANAPPRTRTVQRHEADMYAAKADRLTVRHRHGDVVAVVEIVSPGNKATRAEFRAFVEKSAELLRQGVHLLVVDVFRPGKHDPQGIHHAVWNQFADDEFELPPNQPLTLVGYGAGPPQFAYVENYAVGDVLPEMPLFLKPETYVPAPLETAYQTAWSVFPAPLKRLL